MDHCTAPSQLYQLCQDTGGYFFRGDCSQVKACRSLKVCDLIVRQAGCTQVDATIISAFAAAHHADIARGATQDLFKYILVILTMGSNKYIRPLIDCDLIEVGLLYVRNGKVEYLRQAA